MLLSKQLLHSLTPGVILPFPCISRLYGGIATNKVKKITLHTLLELYACALSCSFNDIFHYFPRGQYRQLLWRELLQVGMTSRSSLYDLSEALDQPLLDGMERHLAL